ncbi:hypothetical protein T484DRAFT_1831948, partial [Baffinella frigidus]
MGKNVFGEMCAITGAPAKYRDPVSGLPYADLAAFRVIKERYHTAKPVEAEVPEAPAQPGGDAPAAPAQPAPDPAAHAPAAPEPAARAPAATESATQRPSAAPAAPGADARILAALKDDRLRQLVREVDAAPDRLKALQDARKDPQ